MRVFMVKVEAGAPSAAAARLPEHDRPGSALPCQVRLHFKPKRREATGSAVCFQYPEIATAGPP